MHRKRTVVVAVAVISILAATTVAVSAATGARRGQSVVKVMMIGYPDRDSTDPVTGVKVPGIGQLKDAFEKANPSIDLQIINIPWGSGATSYSAKTDAMVQAGDACLYEMPGAPQYGRQGKLVDLSTLIKKD